MSKFKKNFNIIFSGVSGSIGNDNPEETLAKELYKYNAVSDKVDFGILYNAMTEKRLGVDFKKREAYKNIVLMADSGGYQLAVGKIKSGGESAKRQVYINQAKNADYGFCFDEVPVSGEYYDHTKALEKTLQTNANIKKQIEVFKELNTDCLIFPIAKVQPDDKEISYENLLKDCDLNLIAGLAANTNIFGDYFAYPFFFKEFRNKVGLPNVLHHLGTGSPKSMLPFYLLAREGFFGKNFVYIVDATNCSHSMLLRSSIVMENGKMQKFSEFSDSDYNKWKEYCLRNMPELCENKTAFHNINRHQTLSVKGGLFKVFIISSLSYGMKMFLKMVEDPYKFAANNNILTFQQLQSIKELAKCSDWKDYYEWKGIFDKVWSNKKGAVAPLARNTLDGFF